MPPFSAVPIANGFSAFSDDTYFKIVRLCSQRCASSPAHAETIAVISAQKTPSKTLYISINMIFELNFYYD